MADEAATGTLTITGATGTGPASWEQVAADIDAEAAGDHPEPAYRFPLTAIFSPLALFETMAMATIQAMCAYISATLSPTPEQVGADIDGEAVCDWSE